MLVGGKSLINFFTHTSLNFYINKL